MEIGLTGLPGAGKTTVFNALAQAKVQVATSYGTSATEPHRAVVRVPDERVTLLADLFSPKKITPAEVRYVDVAGQIHSDGDADRSSQVVAQLRTADALLIVVRAFESDVVPHPLGSVDPIRDLETVTSDLLLNDLVVVEKRLERLARDLRFASKSATPSDAVRENDILTQIKAQLDNGQPIRTLELAEADAKLLRGYGFLTQKPTLVVFNVGDSFDNAPALIERAEAILPATQTGVIALAGKLEMELAELSPDEAKEFMEALGIEELGLRRVIELSYGLLDLISFLTAGADECRAWTIRRGTTAVDAAGVIHSDLSRGFIRAEVIYWKDLLDAGGLVEAKRRGLVRSEGKTYVVADGDVLNILFNV